VFACGLRAGGKALCWGDDAPSQSLGNRAFVQVSAGEYSICGRSTDDTLTCTSDLTPPKGTYADVTTGSRFACARKANGAVTCWGDNKQGATEVPPGAYKSVGAGDFTVCGIRTNGNTVSWGGEPRWRGRRTGGRLQPSFGGSRCGLCWESVRVRAEVVVDRLLG
jgi:hypothetical protein